jgi:hypothetical protein
VEVIMDDFEAIDADLTATVVGGLGDAAKQRVPNPHQIGQPIPEEMFHRLNRGGGPLYSPLRGPLPPAAHDFQ